MSIAVSATIKPSRLLFWLQLAMTSCVLAVGVCVGFGMTGNYAVPAKAAIASASLIFAFLALFHIRQQRKTFRLDISGIGKIRIRHDEDGHQAFAAEWEIVRLTEASTLWPKLMFLCLESELGRNTVLCVLPDCVSAAEFRALSVACRWIAARIERQDDSV